MCYGSCEFACFLIFGHARKITDSCLAKMTLVISSNLAYSHRLATIERERSLFAISVTTNTKIISHNGGLPERKTPSQLVTYDSYNQ